jgi:large subunit ribosomal protein L24
MNRIKVGDLVEVVAGNDKGKQGKILRFNKDRNRIFVEKVKLVKRHTKPTQDSPQGGVVEKESSVHISNVMLIDPKDKKPGRVGIKRAEGKDPVRVFKKTGTELK